ncbi:hypothetical protein Tco_1524893, partial [Tanacetum coccineum]
MSNTNTNLQTQTSNVLHNAIMEAGGKDSPPMLAPGNYVQWKSRIKRYIDTKPNNELIHYCLQNSPYKFKLTEKTVPVSEGSSETTIEGYMKNYKNVSQDIRDQLNSIERLKQGEAINVQDLETNLYWEFGKFTSRDGESLESYYSRFVTLVKQSQELKTVSYHKLYDILKQHQNEVNEIRAKILAHHNKLLPETEENQLSTLLHQDQEPEMVAEDDAFRANQDNTLRINRGTGYDNQRVVNVARTRENVGCSLSQGKDVLCKQEKARFQLNAEQADWRDDTDDEPEDQELEAHYMYMAQIQEVTPDAADNSRPIFDAEPLQKVQNDDDNYNVFDNDQEHPEQHESVNEPYLVEQD